MTYFARHAGASLACAIMVAVFAAPALSAELPPLIAAANSGDAKAQFDLGNAYMKGEGVKKDVSRGVKLCRAAADQGYTPAQSELALKYASGDGVPKNNVESEKWMVLAASADPNYKSVETMVEGRMTRRDLRRGHAAAAQWKIDHAAVVPIEASGPVH